MTGMNESEYLRLKAKIDTEHQSKLRALNQVWAMDNEGTPPPKSINGHTDAGNCRPRLLAASSSPSRAGKCPIGNQFTVKRATGSHFRQNPAIETDAIGVSIYMKKAGYRQSGADRANKERAGEERFMPKK